MKYKYIAYIKLIVLVIFISFITVCSITAKGKYSTLQSKYTKEHPLIILCDWEYPPYEFCDDNGKSSGYNIDIINRILNNINIPHVFKMREWHIAIDIFEHRKADLIVDPTNKLIKGPHIYGKTILVYQNIMIMHRKGTPIKKDLKQFGTHDTIIAKARDVGQVELELSGFPKSRMVLQTAKDAVLGVAEGRYKYFLWEEQPLKWMIRKYQLNNVELSEINLPTTQIRFMGYDKNLINALDLEFAKLEQSGELTKIVNKWFYPERIHEDTSPIAFVIIFILAILILIFLLSVILIKKRLKITSQKVSELNDVMIQALENGHNDVIELNLKNNVLHNIYGNFIPNDNVTMDMIIKRVHPDDVLKFKDFLKDIKEKKTNNIKAPFNFRWHKENSKEWSTYRSLTITESDKNDKIVNIIITLADITNDIKKQKEEKILADKYHNIYDNALIGLGFFDKNGDLVSMNRQMYEMFHIKEGHTIQNNKKFNLFDIQIFSDIISPDDLSDKSVCSKIDIFSLNLHTYIELKMFHIYDKAGHLLFISTTSRDIKSERNLYIKTIENNKKLKEAYNRINIYNYELSYLLKSCKINMINIETGNDIIIFNKNMENATTIRRGVYIKSLAEEYRQPAIDNLTKLDKGEITDMSFIRKFIYTDVDNKECWYAISYIADKDENGKTKGVFGIARNITTQMEIEEKLKDEKEKADDSAHYKSLFLANMSHEIRTPLNAIVGFSDLLQNKDLAENKNDFARIIRTNCELLMRLLNDILDLSDMVSNGLSLKYEDVDFSKSFKDICSSLSQRITNPEVTFIKENPYDKFNTRLDVGRVQQIITNFVTNAIKYTKKGHIRLGYRYENKGLYIYCEDTGAGISKEGCKKIFGQFVKLNDFVQGTGLGLSICKTIADKYGGKIGVNSELGKGSLFWVWIPCVKQP